MHCSHRDTSPGSGVTRTGRCQGQPGARPATPPQPTPARPPSRLPPASHGAHPREASAPGARGHRGGASSALRAQDRHLAAGVGRAAQAARSHPDPARQARRHPALPPPPHPGPHLPFSWTRGVFATPVPRTGAPPRRGRSEPLVRTRNPAALEHAQRAPSSAPEDNSACPGFRDGRAEMQANQ